LESALPDFRPSPLNIKLPQISLVVWTEEYSSVIDAGCHRSGVAEDSICQDDRCSTELITGGTKRGQTNKKSHPPHLLRK